MPTEDVIIAVAKLKEKSIPIRHVDPASEDLIQQIEQKLRIEFPPSYRYLVKNFGILTFAGKEIYGITKGGLHPKGLPSVLWATERSRERAEISDKMIRIMVGASGALFVIDTSIVESNGESPVYQLPVAGISYGMAKDAQDFGKFLLNEVESTLEFSRK